MVGKFFKAVGQVQGKLGEFIDQDVAKAKTGVAVGTMPDFPLPVEFSLAFDKTETESNL